MACGLWNYDAMGNSEGGQMKVYYTDKKGTRRAVRNIEIMLLLAYLSWFEEVDIDELILGSTAQGYLKGGM